MKPRRLTPEQAAHNERCTAIILAAVAKPQGATSDELAQAVGVSRSTVHKHLDRMADQLVAREGTSGRGVGRNVRYFANAADADAWRSGAGAVLPRPIKPSKKAAAKAEEAARKCAVDGHAYPVVSISHHAAGARVLGDIITTPATRYTIDTIKRPNSRIEAAPALPADPRWPSFAAEWQQLRGRQA